MDAVQQAPPVRWLIVIVGIVLALVAGCIIGPLSTLLAMGVFTPHTLVPQRAGMLLLGVGVPLTLFATTYFLTRLYAPNFAKGVAIGGSIMVLLCGLCNSILDF